MPSTETLSLRHSQNFLTHPRLIDRLLALSTLARGDLVYEPGAGTGSITERLAWLGCRVLAVELDSRLARRLRRRFAGDPRVTVRQADLLADRLPCEPYKVFGSPPFGSSAAIVAKLTSGVSPPEDTYLVLQREAAERYAGLPHETLASLLLKPSFEPSILFHFRRTDFTPPPAVDAVLLRLRKRAPPLIPAPEAQAYRDFIIYAFTARRPMLSDTLGSLLGRSRYLPAARQLGIGANATPTSMSLEQWWALFAWFQRQVQQELPRHLAQRAEERVHGAETRLRRQQARLRRPHRTRLRKPDCVERSTESGL